MTTGIIIIILKYEVIYLLMCRVSSMNGYGNGKVFTANNGIKYLFISVFTRRAFELLTWDAKKFWRPTAMIGKSWIFFSLPLEILIFCQFV